MLNYHRWYCFDAHSILGIPILKQSDGKLPARLTADLEVCLQWELLLDSESRMYGVKRVDLGDF